MKEKKYSPNAGQDWKGIVVGVSVIVGVSAVGWFGMRTSLSMIDYYKTEAMHLIDQDYEQLRVKQHSQKQMDLQQKAQDVPKRSLVTEKESNDVSNVDTEDSDSVSEVTDTISKTDVITESAPESSLAQPEPAWHEAYPEIQQTAEGLLYVIQRGDTMIGIASKFGFGVTELAAYNQISNPSQIFVGSTLLFPPEGPSDIGDMSVGLG